MLILEGTRKKLTATLTLTVALCFLLVAPTLAYASTPTLKSLAASLAALQKTVKSEGVTIASLKKSLSLANAKIAAIEANKALKLSWLPTYLSLSTSPINGVVGPNIVFRGCNLQIKSATSETDATGTGNLIVGWNNAPGGTLPSPFRSGSNNLVCGNYNNFTSFGGFLAGD